MTMVYFWLRLSDVLHLLLENLWDGVLNDPGEEDVLVLVGVERGTLIDTWSFKDQVNKRKGSTT